MDATEENKVLWLASWYPNREDRSDGDFIQRHARAVALFYQVHVIYVMKAKKGSRGDEREINVEGNLTEEIIYYSPFRTGIRPLDRFLSQRKFNKCYRKAITAYITEKGKPPLVHVHVAMKAGLAAIWAKKKWDIHMRLPPMALHSQYGAILATVSIKGTPFSHIHPRMVLPYIKGMV